MACFDGDNKRRLFIHLGFNRSSGKHRWFYSVAIHWYLEKNPWRTDDSQCMSTDGRHWNTAHYFGWQSFPTANIIIKPHGYAKLQDDKRNFNYRIGKAGLVTEEAFGRWKIRFRVLFRNVKVTGKLPNYMACPALCFITFVLNGVI